MGGEEEQGKAAMVAFSLRDILTLINASKRNKPPIEQPHLDIINRLDSWGGTWMWEHLEYEEDLWWVSEGLRAGTLVCLMDGPYNREHAHDISGAGWIIYCTQTK